ncbi:hypothetical protein [Actinosynnema sp. NPDC023587]|uniref:hypothetical protein n=1 Tax=Actinosynnema sp. NPDC023587 TaxID=3154695 RepID=UPI0033E412F6
MFWFIGAHMVVQWYVRACDATSPGMFVIAVTVLFAGLLLFVGYAVGSHFLPRLVGRSWNRYGRVALVLVGAVLVTWGYWSFAVPALTDDTLFLVNCDGRHPAGWPGFIPLP